MTDASSGARAPVWWSPPHRRTTALCLLGGLVGIALAWLLAGPNGPDPAAAVQVLADLAGSTVLGLCVLDWLQRDERRPVVPRPNLWRPIAVVAGGWALVELLLLVVTATATTTGPLTTATLTRFVREVSSGQVGASVVAVSASIAIAAAVAFRHAATWPTAPFAVVTAAGLLVRPVTGHMSVQPLGSVLVAAHVLAAALWLGPLVAMALMLRGRRAWAALLPRFSELAVVAVVLLTATGVVDAAVALGGVDALVGTGYGRILLAKAVALAGLLALGWWWRRTWVPAAVGHRIAERDSLRRAVTEVTALAVVFGLAAALATTGL